MSISNETDREVFDLTMFLIRIIGDLNAHTDDHVKVLRQKSYQRGKERIVSVGPPYMRDEEVIVHAARRVRVIDGPSMGPS